MAYRQAFLAAVVAAVIAACAPSPAASPAQVPTAVATAASPTTAASTSLEPTDSPQSPSPAPTAKASPNTRVPVPPTPSVVSFDEKRKGDDASSVEITQMVRWAAPRTTGVEIRVYGVTKCIAMPAKPSPGAYGPCVVGHTRLSASVLKLLARAPSSDRVADWTWTGTFDCEIGMAYDPRGPAYYAIVLAAYSRSGHSTFAIAEPGLWSEPGPNDIVC